MYAGRLLDFELTDVHGRLQGLKCGFSPGEIVLLTAAHHSYPATFLIDVQTSCPEIWDNNPYVRFFAETDSDVVQIDCAFPLINRSNTAPHHVIHLIEFLNERVGLNIKPTEFKGDIHLSGEEASWLSQVAELVGQEIPFWILGAGGKYDLTIKSWEATRYQQVIDHFWGQDSCR